MLYQKYIDHAALSLYQGIRENDPVKLEHAASCLAMITSPEVSRIILGWDQPAQTLAVGIAGTERE